MVIQELLVCNNGITLLSGA